MARQYWNDQYLSDFRKKAGIVSLRLISEKELGRSPSDFLWNSGISPMVLVSSCLGTHFSNFCWIQGWKGSGDECWCLTWFLSLSCYFILAVYFVASLYLTSMISFSSATVGTTRHSFGPPSSFDWMDLARVMIRFYNHCLGTSDLGSLVQRQHPTDQGKKKISSLGEESPHQ